jgi:hypothetical protein
LADNVFCKIRIINKEKQQMAITKQQVADYINANYQSSLTADDLVKIDQALTPELAAILIKLLGDVSFLVHVRDNESN